MIPCRRVVSRAGVKGLILPALSQRVIVPHVITRYQSTVGAASGVPIDNTANEPRQPIENKGLKDSKNARGPKKAPKRQRQERNGGNGGANMQAFNQKVKDVTQQIEETLNTDVEYGELKSILEEGITFLRDSTEAIGNTTRVSIELHRAFTPLTITFYNKAKNIADVNSEELLEFLISIGLANQYHFTDIAQQLLKEATTKPENYQKVLQYWVRFREYETTHRSFVLDGTLPEGVEYVQFQFPSFAYYSYVMICVHQNAPYSAQDAMRFSFNDSVPHPARVKLNLVGGKCFDNTEFKRFTDFIRQEEQKNIDPNGPQVNSDLFRLNDVHKIDDYYLKTVEMLKERNEKFTERTLTRFMNRYYSIGKYDRVFALFEKLVSSGIKPSITAWNAVLRSIITRDTFRDKSSEERTVLMKKFERMVATIKASGAKFDADTLGAIVNAYCVAGQFERAKECMNEYKDLGVNNVAKEEYMRALIFNGQIPEAEERFQEYMKQEDSTFSRDLLNDFLAHYSKQKNYRAMFGIKEFMDRHNLEPNTKTLTLITQAYIHTNVQMGKTPDIMAFLNSFKGSTRFNENTYTVILTGLIKSANIEAARELYKVLKKKYPNSPWIQSNMITMEMSLGDIATGERLFAHYIKNIKNDAFIWNTAIKNLLDRDENLAMEYYNGLKNQERFKPNMHTYQFIFEHFVRKGNAKRLAEVLDDLANNPLKEYGTLSKIFYRISPLTEIPKAVAERAKFDVNKRKTFV